MRLRLLHEMVGQTWSGSDDGPEYSVPELYRWAERHKPVVQVLVTDLAHEFGSGVSVSDEPDDSPEFAARAARADLKYPLLLVRYHDGKIWVIDGRHRLYKAMGLDLPAVRAYVIDHSELPATAIV